MTHYDLIIVGAGSAGYPAGMYASRYKIKNLIIGFEPGGALATSHRVENWPGIISAPGDEIMKDFKKQAEFFGSDIVQDYVQKIEKKDKIFEVVTSGKKTYTSDYVILATGNSYKNLGVKGEQEFLGRGVSYCATCDGNFFKDMEVVMVGGGNTALSESLYLADICKKVTIVHRRDTFRAETIWVEHAQKRENIEFILQDEVQEITGGFGVEQVILKSGKVIPAMGIFIAIGSTPNTSLLDDFGLPKDDEGCIVVDQRQWTGVPGLYAAGDVTTNSNKFKQTIMSAAEGCLAADSIHQDILKK